MIRRDITEFTGTQLDALGRAFNKIYDDGLIENNAVLHSQSFWQGIHWGPAFLPWHRDFLLKLEASLRQYEPTITLPYWDWTTPDSRKLNDGIFESLLGGRDNTGGKFDHWAYFRNNNDGGHTLPALDDIVVELEANSFLHFRRMETGSHVPGHRWTGGSMAGGFSPRDPIFYLHHCNLDRLWAIWQLNNATLEQYEHLGKNTGDTVPAARVPLNSPMIGGTKPAAMLDHAALGYSYTQDAALEAAWRAKHNAEIITHIAPVTS